MTHSVHHQLCIVSMNKVSFLNQFIVYSHSLLWFHHPAQHVAPQSTSSKLPQKRRASSVSHLCLPSKPVWRSQPHLLHRNEYKCEFEGSQFPKVCNHLFHLFHTEHQVRPPSAHDATVTQVAVPLTPTRLYSSPLVTPPPKSLIHFCFRLKNLKTTSCPVDSTLLCPEREIMKW